MQLAGIRISAERHTASKILCLYYRAAGLFIIFWPVKAKASQYELNESETNDLFRIASIQKSYITEQNSPPKTER